VVLAEAAGLSDVPPELLAPGALPGPWAGERLRLAELEAYFAGGKVVQVPREGYEEAMVIPRAAPEALHQAVAAAVQQGKLWLLAGAGSVWREAVLPGLLSGEAELLAPPAALHPASLLPDQLPAAWAGESTTGRALLEALSAKAGRPLPWPLVGEAISTALQARILERPAESGPWPCDLAGAALVLLRVPSQEPQPTHVPVPRPVPPPTSVHSSPRLRHDQVGQPLPRVDAVDRHHVRVDRPRRPWPRGRSGGGPPGCWPGAATGP
jgi:hypothetical protein